MVSIIVTPLQLEFYDKTIAILIEIVKVSVMVVLGHLSRVICDYKGQITANKKIFYK